MNTCCYLQLLCKLFDMVVSGASQGPRISSFRALLQPLLQVLVKTRYSKLDALSAPSLMIYFCFHCRFLGSLKRARASLQVPVSAVELQQQPE